MNNFKAVTRSSGFTIISNDIIKNKNLSLKAKGLLVTLLSLPPDWHFTEKGLSTITNTKITSLKTGLKELEQNNYLHRYQSRNNGNFGPMVYLVFDQPTLVEMDGESIEPKKKQPNETEQNVPTGVFNINKDNELYEYLNGGWMLE